MWWTLFPLCRPPGEAPGRAHHQAQLLAHAARHLPAAAAAEAWNQLLTWCWELLLELLVTAEVCCLSLPLFLAVCCLSATLLLRYRWVFLFSSGQPPTQQPHVLLLLGVYCLALGHCHDSSVRSREHERRGTTDKKLPSVHTSAVCSVCCCPDARSLYNCTDVQLYTHSYVTWLKLCSFLTFLLLLLFLSWNLYCADDGWAAAEMRKLRRLPELQPNLCEACATFYNHREGPYYRVLPGWKLLLLLPHLRQYWDTMPTVEGAFSVKSLPTFVWSSRDYMDEIS